MTKRELLAWTTLIEKLRHQVIARRALEYLATKIARLLRHYGSYSAIIL